MKPKKGRVHYDDLDAADPIAVTLHDGRRYIGYYAGVVRISGRYWLDLDSPVGEGLVTFCTRQIRKITRVAASSIEAKRRRRRKWEGRNRKDEGGSRKAES